jgi:K+-sensing histidine kinase KdpD
VVTTTTRLQPNLHQRAAGSRCRSRPFLIYSARPASVMRALKGVLPIVVSVGVIMAVTALLWQLRLAANSSQHLIYIYLFPVTLIAALYNGRLAVLSTVIALLCADFFLEGRLYSFVDDNHLEYGDLFVFAILAVTAIKFIRVLLRPRTSLGANSRSA